MNRLIQTVKFGGSMLTYSEKKPTDINYLMDYPKKYIRPDDEIRRYARETLKAWNERSSKIQYELWLFHGVRQYGHDVVNAIGKVPEVRRYCKFMSDIIVNIFQNEGLPVEQIDLADISIWDKKLKIYEVEEFLKRGRNVIKNGKIPISWGTIVDKIPGGYAIISGDDALLYTGLIRRADEAVMYIDVPVCDRNPKNNKDAKPLDVIKSYKDLSITVNERDKTGGLIGKIKKLGLLAISGTMCQIVDATKERNIYNSLMGNVIGTLIKPEI